MHYVHVSREGRLLSASFAVRVSILIRALSLCLFLYVFNINVIFYIA